MAVTVGRNVGARYERRLRRYFEYAVVVIVVSLLGVGMTERLSHLQGHVETLTLQSEVDTLRAAVVLEGIRKIRGTLPGSNPMELLEAPFQVYEGVTESVDIPELNLGVWIFDKTAGVLIYRAKHETTELPDNLPGRVLTLGVDRGNGDESDMYLVTGSQ